MPDILECVRGSRITQRYSAAIHEYLAIAPDCKYVAAYFSFLALVYDGCEGE